jgi:nucleoside-diphosphate-sugar epimerase
MPLPRIIVTGASGFVGRHLLDALKERYQIFALARRSQERCGAPVHRNIAWFQVDVGDRPPLAAMFHAVQDGGGADVVVHLAAHYDFTGEDHPEYWRTNVEGLRNVLELCRRLRPRHFVFASSVAACACPPAGRAVTEASAPDGAHLYSITKRLGEGMLREYRDEFPSVIVRFAALFSDWCEYPPLFMFLRTWLSRAWNARMLAGRGLSAVPYLHVRDATAFLALLLDRLGELAPGEVLLASNDGAVSHLELFRSATANHFGSPRRAIRVPRWLCVPGIRLRDALGGVLGHRPFERPWMARYIDQGLTVDAGATRRRLRWRPTPRLEILRRMPFLIENLRADPLEWNRRNQAALKQVRLRPFLKIHGLLEDRESEIRDLFGQRLLGPAGRQRFPSYQSFDEGEHQWHHRLVLQRLMEAVRRRDKTVFMTYCRDLAARRREQGFSEAELCGALETLALTCRDALDGQLASEELGRAFLDSVTTTIQFGIDQVQEVFEQAALERGTTPPAPVSAEPAKRA